MLMKTLRYRNAGLSKLFLENAGYIGTIFKTTKDVFLYLCKGLFFPL